MLVAVLSALALDVSPSPSSSCSEEVVAAALKTAAAAYKTDRPGAEAALEPVVRCPVSSGATYAAHVLRADLAVGEGDWATARAMLQGVGVHPEAKLSGHAGFLRLRADQGLGDAAAFTRDRDALLAADDAALTRLGRKVETFRVGAGRVDAYEAPVRQGGFLRRFEFVATPDDPAAYSASVQVTDDQGALGVVKATAKPGAPAPEHVWFVDLYTCRNQATLPPPAAALGPPPPYAEMRAAALKALSEPGVLNPTPEKGACFTYLWLLPGLGAPTSPAG